MMIECPRCGFSQPADKYCASCGVDIEQFLARPKPIWVRLIQNPNLHLGLIGILIVLVIGYIIQTQSELVSKRMDQFLNDLPLTSRDAADPNDIQERERARSRAMSAREAKPDETPEAAAIMTAEAASEADAAKKSVAAAEPAIPAISTENKVEIAHWEIPRDILAPLLSSAQRVGESQSGRTYLFSSASKINEQLQMNAQRLTLPRTIAVGPGGQMTQVTPATSVEAFQFGLFVQIVKLEERDLGLRWESQMVLPQVETPQEAASMEPAVRAASETLMSGNATLNANSLLLIVMEPVNRSPRLDFVARAGEGPWTVFASDVFRAGITDWVVVIQIR